MSNDNQRFGRRTVLKGLGAAGAAAAGGIALSGSAAASSHINITSSKASVSNDRGDLSTVTIDPNVTVEWSNLDDAVGKVFYLIEAKVGDGEFHPIFRATPWLNESQMGTSGSLTIDHSATSAIDPLVVADENGKPDYQGIDWTAAGRTSYDTYMSGVSMGSASAYDGLGFQNNYPSVDAGYYGAASDTTPFDNPDDATGTENPKVTSVTLRYTFELQRPNLSQLGEATVEAAAAAYDPLEASDIDTGNSKIVMDGEDGQHDFPVPDGIPYDSLQANDDAHVGVLVGTTAFNVEVTNETSGSGGTGDTNTNAT